MGGDHLRDAAGEPLPGRNVQELVRAVGVGLGAEHPGDEELGLGKLLAEHPHERNGASFAHVHRLGAEVGRGGATHRAVEPPVDRWRLPAGGRVVAREPHPRPVRRVALEDRANRLGRRLRIAGRRKAERELGIGPGAGDVPRVADLGKSARAGYFERRPPGAAEHELDRIRGRRPGPVHEGEPRKDPVAEDCRGLLGLRPSLGRNLRVQGIDEDPAVPLVLEPRKQAADDTERRGHDPAGVPGVDALLQHLDAEGPPREAAERGGAPDRS